MQLKAVLNLKASAIEYTATAVVKIVRYCEAAHNVYTIMAQTW